MARYNEILAGRYARMLQKLFSMKGEVPIGSLAGELSVILNVFSGAENRYLEQWNRFGVNTDAGPVAANQSGARFRNPVGSNVIVVVEKLTLNSVATDRFFIQQGQATVDLGTVIGTQGSRLDSRTGTSGSTLIVSQQATAPALPALGNQFTIWANFLLANTPYDAIADENQELTILPGDALQLSALTVNERFLSALVWRERSLEESERT